jgi:putative Holliday junction resolvase
MKLRGKVCALDLGDARVGLALSDELGMLAHPRGTLDARPEPELLGKLADLARDEGIVRFVVGLPLDMKGGEGEAARKVRALAQKIADRTGREVELWDERLTTVEATRRMAEGDVRGKKARRHVDEAAAAVILQAWLDRRAAPGGD